MEWSNPNDQKKQDILDALQKEHSSSIPTFKAMDEYAKQQTIAFGEWLRKNRWFPQENLSKPDCWRFFNHDTEEDQEKSTQQLHAQFIESQQTNNQ